MACQLASWIGHTLHTWLPSLRLNTESLARCGRLNVTGVWKPSAIPNDSFFGTQSLQLSLTAYSYSYLRLTYCIATVGPRLDTKCVGSTLSRQHFQLLAEWRFRGAQKVIFHLLSFFVLYIAYQKNKFRWLYLKQIYILLENGRVIHKIFVSSNWIEAIIFQKMT